MDLVPCCKGSWGPEGATAAAAAAAWEEGEEGEGQGEFQGAACPGIGLR